MNVLSFPDCLSKAIEHLYTSDWINDPDNAGERDAWKTSWQAAEEEREKICAADSHRYVLETREDAKLYFKEREPTDAWKVIERVRRAQDFLRSDGVKIPTITVASHTGEPRTNEAGVTELDMRVTTNSESYLRLVVQIGEQIMKAVRDCDDSLFFEIGEALRAVEGDLGSRDETKIKLLRAFAKLVFESGRLPTKNELENEVGLAVAQDEDSATSANRRRFNDAAKAVGLDGLKRENKPRSSSVVRNARR